MTDRRLRFSKIVYRKPDLPTLLFPWLCGLTIAGYPLVSALPIIFNVESRRISVPFRAVVLALSILLIAGNLGRKRYKAGFFWTPLFVFWSLYTFRILSDTILSPVPLGRDVSDYYLFAFGVSFIPMLAFMGRFEDPVLSRAFRKTLIIVFLACGFALYLNRLGMILAEGAVPLRGRMGSDTLNSVSLGHLGVSLAIIGAVSFFREKSSFSTWNRILPVVSMGLGILTIGVAGSRAPVVAFLAVFLVFVFSEFELKRSIKILLIGGVLLVSVYQGFLYLESNYGFLAVSRVEDILAGFPEVGDPTRFRLYSDAWHQFLERPVLGSGLEERYSLFYPHNVVIESFMATGILGGLAFCLLMFLAVRTVLKRIRSRSPHKWIDFLFVQYLLGAMFSGSLWGNSIMWCLMAAALTLPVPTEHESSRFGARRKAAGHE